MAPTTKVVVKNQGSANAQINTAKATGIEL